ncbi:unnamed protein product [Closterium sp. NIES-64]|nr:unnamed protein product [Closterium sp. NIES-64]
MMKHAPVVEIARSSQEAATMQSARAMDTSGDRALEDLLEVADPWATSLRERLKLLRHWLEELKATANAAIEAEVRNHAKKVAESRELMDIEDLQVLRKAQVVGMTTSGVAKMQRLITALGPRVIVVEEAAEVLEAHILTSLTPQTQHVILIGDHLQLRPKVEVYELSKDSQKGFDLDVSLFERLALSKQIPIYTLATQRRMRPEIANLIRSTIYPQLTDHPSVQSYPDVRGMATNLHFWDHDSPEKGGDYLNESKSKTNEGEMDLVVGLATYLLQQGYAGGEITILTPYVGQLLKLRQALSRVVNVKLGESDAEVVEEAEEKAAARGGGSRERDGRSKGDSSHGSWSQSKGPGPGESHLVPSTADLKDEVRLATVDNFQGEESTVIIISLVRNNGDGKIGFLKSPNRTNVLLSRAKHGMYIVGNASTMKADPKSVLWPKVLNILKSNDRIQKFIPLQCVNHPDTITHIENASDFKEKASEGGCSQMSSVEVTMPLCGHKQTVKCSEAATRQSNPKLCTARCGVVLSDSCGHECNYRCGDCIIAPDNKAKQEQQGQEQQASGQEQQEHQQQEGTATELRCGHQCPSLCGEKCPSTEYCTAPKCGSKTKREYMVDLVTLETLGEVNPNENPILVLACGHAYTVETLDDHLGLDEVYLQSKPLGGADGGSSSGGTVGYGAAGAATGGDDGGASAGNRSSGTGAAAGGDGGAAPAVGGGTTAKWLAVLPFENGNLSALKGCPDCRQPITGLRRYGRMVNKALLDQSERKFVVECSADQESAQRRLSRLSRAVARCPGDASPNHLDELGQSVTGFMREAERLRAASMNPPTWKTYQASIAALQRKHALLGGPTWSGGRGGASGAGAFSPAVSLEEECRLLYVTQPDARPPCESLIILAKCHELLMTLNLLQLRDHLRNLRNATGHKSAPTTEHFYQYVRGCRITVHACLNNARECLVGAVDWAGKRKAHRLEARARLELVALYRAFVEGMMAERLLWSSIVDQNESKAQQLEYLEKAKVQCRMVAYHDIVSVRNDALGERARRMLEDELPALETSVLDEPRYFVVTEREKDEVYRAMGFGAGHWYRCRNGHVYAIGECGGAMQESRCPECGEVVGKLPDVHLLISSWLEKGEGKDRTVRDEAYEALAGAYAFVGMVALIQLIRIQRRVPEYGWTTQKVFHLLNFVVNALRAVVFLFREEVEVLSAGPNHVFAHVLLDLPGLLFFTTYTLLVLFWAEIYHQARGLPTDNLRPYFMAANVGVYVLQAAIWGVMWFDHKDMLTIDLIAKLFFTDPCVHFTTTLSPSLPIPQSPTPFSDPFPPAVSLSSSSLHFYRLIIFLISLFQPGPALPPLFAAVSLAAAAGFLLYGGSVSPSQHCTSPHPPSSPTRLPLSSACLFPTTLAQSVAPSFLPHPIRPSHPRFPSHHQFPIESLPCPLPHLPNSLLSLPPRFPSPSFLLLLGSSSCCSSSPLSRSLAPFAPFRFPPSPLPLVPIRLFLMLRQFPIESRGRRKKLHEVGFVTLICFSCFIVRAAVVSAAAAVELSRCGNIIGSSGIMHHGDSIGAVWGSMRAAWGQHRGSMGQHEGSMGSSWGRYRVMMMGASQQQWVDHIACSITSTTSKFMSGVAANLETTFEAPQKIAYSAVVSSAWLDVVGEPWIAYSAVIAYSAIVSTAWLDVVADPWVNVAYYAYVHFISFLSSHSTHIFQTPHLFPSSFPTSFPPILSNHPFAIASPIVFPHPFPASFLILSPHHFPPSFPPILSPNRFPSFPPIFPAHFLVCGAHPSSAAALHSLQAASRCVFFHLIISLSPLPPHLPSCVELIPAALLLYILRKLPFDASSST